MRQIVVTRHGGPDVLEVREAPDPVPGPGDVRIAVRATGVNFADILARVGLYPDAPRLPAVVGYEVAGVVDAVGRDVADDRIGESVLALTRFGGYATSVVVPERHAIRTPPQLEAPAAAALPVNYLTAMIALYKLGNVEAGETVLLHGAGGGVGIAAIQLAQFRRARIIGTASAAKHDALRKLGVEDVFDPRDVEIVRAVRRLTSGRGVDVVLDPVGGRHLRQSYDLLAPLGRLVAFGATGALGSGRNWFRAGWTLLGMPSFGSISLINRNRGVSGLNMGRLWGEEERISEWMADIIALSTDGTIRPVIAKLFPFDEARDAHRFLQSRSNIGKVVLTVP